MIKINLIAQPKKFQIPVVMGLDIRMFNFKMLFIVWLFSYTPDLIQKFYFDIETKKVDEKMATHKFQIKKYNKILKKNKNIKRKIEAFDRQAEKLRERERQVLEIIKERTNPFKVLTQIAKSMPENAWAQEINIDRSDLTINGLAVSYKSIGELIDTLNDSIYFSKSVRLQKTESMQQKINKEDVRIEKFTISGEIVRFE
jgi:hypothetical protein